MFKIGDVVKLKYNTHQRLVLSEPMGQWDHDKMIWVDDPEQGLIRVFVSDHELVKDADEESIKEAVQKALQIEENPNWRKW